MLILSISNVRLFILTENSGGLRQTHQVLFEPYFNIPT